MRNKTLDELLEQELIWERQEGDVDLLAWWEEGIRLYRELLRREPNQARYKIQLANLLLKAGGYHKMRKHNYDQARRLFHELIHMDPDHAVAHYRLGFLHYYQQNWKRSIRHFERALEAKPTERTRQISREQKMKALYYLAKAYHQLSLTLYERANGMLAAEEDPAVVAVVEPFLEEARGDLFASGEWKPYVMVTKDQTLALNEEEVLRYQWERPEGELQLDMLGDDMFLLMHPHVRIRLPDQLGKLLRFLMEAKRPVSAQTIRERVFPDSRSDSVVRRTILRLREALYPHLPGDLILTTAEGYQWNWPGDYKIFYRKDDMIWQEIVQG